MGQTLPVIRAARVTCGREAIAYLAPLLPHSGTDERLIVAFLAEDGRVLSHMAQAGDPSGVELPIRSIIVRALIQDAHGLLLGHNHPSGDPTPSRIDIEVTRRLMAALRPLGLVLLDHLIRAQDEWRSLAAMALL